MNICKTHLSALEAKLVRPCCDATTKCYTNDPLLYIHLKRHKLLIQGQDKGLTFLLNQSSVIVSLCDVGGHGAC